MRSYGRAADYDTTPHSEILEQSPHAVLSNRGLKVYAGFDEVVLQELEKMRAVTTSGREAAGNAVGSGSSDGESTDAPRVRTDRTDK